MFTTLVLLITCIFLSAWFWLTLRGHGRSVEPKEATARKRTRRSTVGRRPVCDGITSSERPADEGGGCRCHWPTLFDQKDPYSDCDVRLACDRGAGRLVHRTTRRPLTEAEPPFDIHDYECSACSRCNRPGLDPDTGLPSCVPRPFNDRDGDMCLYGDAGADDVELGPVDGEEDETTTGPDWRTSKAMLSPRSRFVEPGFAAEFADRVRDSARLPNPCAFDAFTGARLDGDCELRMTRGSRIAYCAPTRDNVTTAARDDSYLANNAGGRYPNVCFRFTSHEDRVRGFLVEYFVRRREGPRLPAPVVSARVPAGDVLRPVLEGLGLTRHAAVPGNWLLFTQPEPPADAYEFPHPFVAGRLAAFRHERNDWVDELPARCGSDLLKKLSVDAVLWYNCSAPVQSLEIPLCRYVGTSDRDPVVTNGRPRGFGLGKSDSRGYAETTVSCRDPGYDGRFPVVPNLNLTADSVNADPASAILYFDKSDDTVYPHWRTVRRRPDGRELASMKRYTAEALHSLPNERR